MTAAGASRTQVCAKRSSLGRPYEVQVDDFEPESGDPLHQPGQGSLIWQFRAQGCRVRPDADLAVVEF